MAFLFCRLLRWRHFFSSPCPAKALATTLGCVELCGNVMSGKEGSRAAKFLSGVHKNRPVSAADAAASASAQ